MATRIIIAVVFVTLMSIVGTTTNSLFRVTVEHGLAVEQVEPNDAVVVAMDARNKMRGAVHLIELIITLAVLWLIFKKPIMSAINSESKKDSG